MERLEQYGWTDGLHEQWLALAESGLQPARVIADFGTSLKIATPAIVTAELSGTLAHHSAPGSAPKVGDWVGVRLSSDGTAVIEILIPRRSEIARKVAGKQTRKQVMAANVDVAFVLLAMDDDFSVERLKRFLYQLSISQVASVIVLNKADVADDIAGYVSSVRSLDLPVVVCSATDGTGVAEILTYIKPGRTAMLLGSSGVGKSTLTNRLLGREAQATQAVRETDATGQHTTVHRELFVLPGGGLLIDAPGIRELQLWGTEDDLAENFDDITALAARCKFTTCQHQHEAGCAVRAALQDGRLDRAHYASYLKMRGELQGLQQKSTVKQRQGNKRSRKSLDRQAEDMRRDDW